MAGICQQRRVLLRSDVEDFLNGYQQLIKDYATELQCDAYQGLRVDLKRIKAVEKLEALLVELGKGEAFFESKHDEELVKLLNAGSTPGTASYSKGRCVRLGEAARSLEKLASIYGNEKAL